MSFPNNGILPFSYATFLKSVPPMPMPNQRPEITSDTPITLDELLVDQFLHLVTYEPRYGGGDGAVGVIIGGHIGELAEMAEDMTGSDDEWYHIYAMLSSTPYFPWAEAVGFQAAVDAAMARVNQFSREVWFTHALPEVRKAPTDYPDIRKRHVEWPPLPSMEELVNSEK